MSASSNSPLNAKPRLKFIDMARSIAILMMLEGHFTGAALSWDYRTYDYPLFQFWHLLHGLTSPLFFTVTGVIFAYLLIADKRLSYKENPRVKKGYKRIFQLLFWGYAIQLNLWTIGKSIYYGNEFYLDWTFAFHVLQSIAVGLAILILVYRIYKWINWGSLQWYYFVTGIIIFTAYAFMKAYISADKALIEEGVKQLPSYWPANAPAFIQNMFYGKYSDFSFVRMSGYTVLGGMLGCIIRANEHRVKELWFGLTFIAAGLVLSIFIRPLLLGIDDLFQWMGWLDGKLYIWDATSLSRFGQVIVLIGILILVDKFFTVKAKLFLKVGQTTFPVYVVHVIILYGGLFGFGLKPEIFDRNLSPWAALAISSTAIFAFVMMVKYIEPLTNGYNRVLQFLRLQKKPD